MNNLYFLSLINKDSKFYRSTHEGTTKLTSNGDVQTLSKVCTALFLNPSWESESKLKTNVENYRPITLLKSLSKAP